jgi:tRNA uridine 5-carbamoylmethylation protein Kti12
LLFPEYDRSLALHRHVGLAELQRHRRQFVKASSYLPPASQQDAGATFLDFLALHL